MSQLSLLRTFLFLFLLFLYVSSKVWPIFSSHRLNTILKSDRIIVMDSGRASFFFFLKYYFMVFLFISFLFVIQVAEFDEPQTLLQNPSSIFYSLVQEAGLINQ